MASNHDKVRKGLVLVPGEGKTVSMRGFQVLSKMTDELSIIYSIFEFIVERRLIICKAQRSVGWA
jgi:hypothetical protein